MQWEDKKTLNCHYWLTSTLNQYLQREQSTQIRVENINSMIDFGKSRDFILITRRTLEVCLLIAFLASQNEQCNAQGRRTAVTLLEFRPGMKKKKCADRTRQWCVGQEWEPEWPRDPDRHSQRQTKSTKSNQQPDAQTTWDKQKKKNFSGTPGPR